MQGLVMVLIIDSPQVDKRRKISSKCNDQDRHTISFLSLNHNVEGAQQTSPVWWADLGLQTDAHPAVLPLSLLKRTEVENRVKMLMDQDKDKEITHQFLSQAKQIQLAED